MTASAWPHTSSRTRRSRRRRPGARPRGSSRASRCGRRATAAAPTPPTCSPAAEVAGASAAQTAAARRVLNLRGLARPDAIGRLSGLRQAAAYAYASAAAFHVAGRYGRRRLLALYDAFNDERLTGRPGPALDDRAVRRTLHLSLARLDRDLHDALTAP